MPDFINISITAILTLFVYSYLLRDNALYRIAAHLLVGLGVAYAFTVAVHNILIPNLFLPLQAAATGAPNARLDLLIPFVLGILLLAKAVPAGGKIGNPALATLLGVGIGVAVGGALVGTLVPQLLGSMASLAPVGGVTLAQAITNALVLLATILALLAFRYSRPARTPTLDGSNIAAVNHPSLLERLGRWVLMIAFGALLGGTILTYSHVLVGRWDFLINDWLLGLLRGVV